MDRDRVLARLDALSGYLRELESIAPRDMGEFSRTETKRACERLLQISVECVVDICGLLVRGRRMGLPADEVDLFEKLAQAGMVSPEMCATLRRMKGFRNVLVHDYTQIDDALTFELVRSHCGDFAEFQRQVRVVLAEEDESAPPDS